MKTKMLTIITGVMLMLFNAAEASPTNKKKEVRISNFIENAVNYPNFAKSQGVEGVVNVVVEKNSNQEIQILQIWGSDPRLVKHVENKIKSKSKNAKWLGHINGEPRFVRIRFNLI